MNSNNTDDIVLYLNGVRCEKALFLPNLPIKAGETLLLSGFGFNNFVQVSAVTREQADILDKKFNQPITSRFRNKIHSKPAARNTGRHKQPFYHNQRW